MVTFSAWEDISWPSCPIWPLSWVRTTCFPWPGRGRTGWLSVRQRQESSQSHNKDFIWQDITHRHSQQILQQNCFSLFTFKKKKSIRRIELRHNCLVWVSEWQLSLSLFTVLHNNFHLSALTQIKLLDKGTLSVARAELIRTPRKVNLFKVFTLDLSLIFLCFFSRLSAERKQ